MKKLIILIFLSLFSISVFAGSTHSAAGTVESVKGDKVAIAHGPIKSMGMGAMTMEFSVADPAMMEELKKGKKVKFKFEEKKTGLVITELE